MIKVNLLLDVISNLRSLGDSLQVVADAMEENEASATDATTQEEAKKEKKSSKKSAAKKQQKEEDKNITGAGDEPKAATKKQYTLEEVRGFLAEKSQSGFTAEVKTLIEKYGGNKLSDINPENYAAIIKEAKVLGGE